MKQLVSNLFPMAIKAKRKRKNSDDHKYKLARRLKNKIWNRKKLKL